MTASKFNLRKFLSVFVLLGLVNQAQASNSARELSSGFLGILVEDSICEMGSADLMTFSGDFSSGPRVHGFSCERLRRIGDSLTMLNVALIAPNLALRNPTLQRLLTTHIAKVGPLMSNPAFLTVTLIGATGITVGYFMLKNSIEECQSLEREQLKQMIVEELESRLDVRPGPQLNFEIQK